MAAISWKFAEKVSDPLARLMVTTLSSIGWRITSSTRVPNSRNIFYPTPINMVKYK